MRERERDPSGGLYTWRKKNRLQFRWHDRTANPVYSSNSIFARTTVSLPRFANFKASESSFGHSFDSIFRLISRLNFPIDVPRFRSNYLFRDWKKNKPRRWTRGIKKKYVALFVCAHQNVSRDQNFCSRIRARNFPRGGTNVIPILPHSSDQLFLVFLANDTWVFNIERSFHEDRLPR